MQLTRQVHFREGVQKASFWKGKIRVGIYVFSPPLPLISKNSIQDQQGLIELQIQHSMNRCIPILFTGCVLVSENYGNLKYTGSTILGASSCPEKKLSLISTFPSILLFKCPYAIIFNLLSFLKKIDSAQASSEDQCQADIKYEGTHPYSIGPFLAERMTGQAPWRV